MQFTLGIVLLIMGGAAAFNALPAIRRVGRTWPRQYTRGDAHNLISSAFLIRWIGLFVALAGAGLILIAMT